MKKIIFLLVFSFLSFFSLFTFTNYSPQSVLAVGDTNPPSVSITNPTHISTVLAGSQVNITATANDDVGVTSVEFYVNNTLLCTDTDPSYSCLWSVPSNIGVSYVINAKAYDYSLNMGQTYNLVFSVGATNPPDTTPPTVSFTNPTDGSNVSAGSTVTLTATASDNIGVNRVEFYADGSLKCTDYSAPYSCNWLVPQSVTNHTLIAKAIDTSSNFSQNSIYVNSIDTTVPTVNITNPLNGSNVSAGSQVNITANASDNINIDYVEFYIDSSLVCTDNIAPYSCNWSVPQSVTNHTLIAKAIDTSSNFSQSTITVYSVDTTVPEVSITNPLSASNVSAGSQVNVTANASDNINIDRVEFYINSSLACTDSIAPYSCDWLVPQSITNHTLVAKAFDNSSNYSQHSISVNSIDTTVPTVNFTYPTSGGTVPRNTTITMTANSSDNIGVNRVEFYVDGVLKCTDYTSSYSCNWQVPRLRDIQYTLLAKSYDAAGNFSQQTIIVTSY